jgi:hypothetical protein
MAESMKRYEMHGGFTRSCEDGRLCSFEDVEPIIEQLATLRAENERLRKVVEEFIIPVEALLVSDQIAVRDLSLSPSLCDLLSKQLTSACELAREALSTPGEQTLGDQP